jgi:hypothetical protein
MLEVGNAARTGLCRRVCPSAPSLQASGGFRRKVDGCEPEERESFRHAGNFLRNFSTSERIPPQTRRLPGLDSTPAVVLEVLGFCPDDNKQNKDIVDLVVTKTVTSGSGWRAFPSILVSFP